MHNIFFYLYKMVWPANLSAHYLFPENLGPTHSMARAGLIGTFILLIILLISWRWTRALATGWLIFFVAIFPTMGVIGFTHVIASDKYAYFPAIGILMIFAWAFGGLWRWGGGEHRFRSHLVPVAMTVLVAVAVAAEFVGTRRYLTCWQTTEKLYAHMLQCTPDSPFLLNEYALELSRQGKDEQARPYYERSFAGGSELRQCPFELRPCCSSGKGSGRPLSNIWSRRSSCDLTIWKAGSTWACCAKRKAASTTRSPASKKC